jgi:ElaB/YqjD/DUF883 family membrane-anchored ribosome-binding protein
MENVANIPERRAHPGIDAQYSSSSLSREFRNVLSDIESLFKATTSVTGEELVRAKAKLSSRIEDAKKTFSQASDNIVHQAKETAATTNKYVHENPWQAVGAGATLGLLLGLFLARRK